MRKNLMKVPYYHVPLMNNCFIATQKTAHQETQTTPVSTQAKPVTAGSLQGHSQAGKTRWLRLFEKTIQDPSSTPYYGLNFLRSSPSEIAKHVEISINDWVENAHPFYAESYAAAAQVMKACLRNHEQTTLELDAENLLDLPLLPPYVNMLKLNLGKGKKLPNLGNARHLEGLDLSGNAHLSEPFDLSDFKALQTLNLKDCESLEQGPNLEGCMQLEALFTNRCTAMVTSPKLPPDNRIKFMLMERCPALKKVENLEHCGQLEVLSLAHNTRMQGTVDLSHNPEMKMLYVKHCTGLNLEKPVALPHDSKLKTLDMSGLPFASHPAWVDALPEGCEARFDVAQPPPTQAALAALAAPAPAPKINPTALAQPWCKPCLQAVQKWVNLAPSQVRDIYNQQAGYLMQSVPEALPPHLRALKLSLGNSTTAPDLSNATSVRVIDMAGADHLETLPKLPPHSTTVRAARCSNLKNADTLQHCAELRVLDLKGCSALKGELILPSPHLSMLEVSGCTELEGVKITAHLEHLPTSVLTLGRECQVCFEGGLSDRAYQILIDKVLDENYAGPRLIEVTGRARIEDTFAPAEQLTQAEIQQRIDTVKGWTAI
jgi:hypothetical protein